MFSFFDIKPNLFSDFEWAYLDLFQTYLVSIVYHALGKGVKIMCQRVAVASFITDMRPKQFILFLSQTFNSPYFPSALWRPILFSTYGSVVHNFLQAVKEKETLRRSYFLFVGAVVTNDVTVVLTSQSEWQVLVSSLHWFFIFLYTFLFQRVLNSRSRLLGFNHGWAIVLCRLERLYELLAYTKFSRFLTIIFMNSVQKTES